MIIPIWSRIVFMASSSLATACQVTLIIVLLHGGRPMGKKVPLGTIGKNYDPELLI
jgi:hypothetical protein